MRPPADIAKDSGRDFTRSHPWISFRLNLAGAPWKFWELIGEARSKYRHLTRSPLPPGLAQRLSGLYLAKGVHATTAIEGNTLTEDQVLEAIEGRLSVPPSQAYLEREVDNVLEACAAIEARIYGDGQGFELTPASLAELNRMVLDGLQRDGVAGGEMRTHSVVVGNVYRGAPAADCPFLVELMCDWLNGPDFAAADDPRESFFRVVAKAIVAHVYIAWIHPFGDGNGRTARLAEFGILTSAGLPTVAAHLLSNHYNATRAEYYRQLDHASKSGGDLRPFLTYAVEGLVDQLQAQLNDVQAMNLTSAWRDYVHESFHGEATVAPQRQLALVLSLPEAAWTPRSAIPSLNGELAAAYAGKGPKTVTRDINALEQRQLIVRRPDGIRPRTEIMLSFLPPSEDRGPL